MNMTGSAYALCSKLQRWDYGQIKTVRPARLSGKPLGSEFVGLLDDESITATQRDVWRGFTIRPVSAVALPHNE
jgi:hypothetical protein